MREADHVKRNVAWNPMASIRRNRFAAQRPRGWGRRGEVVVRRPPPPRPASVPNQPPPQGGLANAAHLIGQQDRRTFLIEAAAASTVVSYKSGLRPDTNTRAVGRRTDKSGEELAI